MPFPKPRPKELCNEGWQYAVIYGTPKVEKRTIFAGKENEQEAIILRVQMRTVVPDGSGHVDCDIKSDIFIKEETDDPGANFLYQNFLEALGVPCTKVEIPGAGEIEMLPDPEPESYKGRMLKTEVKHREWEAKKGANAGMTFVNAEARSFKSWDGKAPDGEEIAQPIQPSPQVMGGEDKKDDEDPPW